MKSTAHEIRAYSSWRLGSPEWLRGIPARPARHSFGFVCSANHDPASPGEHQLLAEYELHRALGGYPGAYRFTLRSERTVSLECGTVTVIAASPSDTGPPTANILDRLAIEFTLRAE